MEKQSIDTKKAAANNKENGNGKKVSKRKEPASGEKYTLGKTDTEKRVSCWSSATSLGRKQRWLALLIMRLRRCNQFPAQFPALDKRNFCGKASFRFKVSSRAAKSLLQMLGRELPESANTRSFSHVPCPRYSFDQSPLSRPSPPASSPASPEAAVAELRI